MATRCYHAWTRGNMEVTRDDMEVTHDDTEVTWRCHGGAVGHQVLHHLLSLANVNQRVIGMATRCCHAWTRGDMEVTRDDTEVTRDDTEVTRDDMEVTWR